MHSPSRAEDPTPPSLLTKASVCSLSTGEILPPWRTEAHQNRGMKKAQICKTYTSNKGSYSPTLTSPLEWDTSGR